VRAGRRGAVLIAAAALFLESFSPVFAEAISAGLKQCAAIASSDTRLACYDALSGRSAHGAVSSVAPARATPPTAAPATAAPAPAIPAAAPAAAKVVPAPAPVPATPPDPAEAARNFGLSGAQLHSAPQGPQSIEAHVSRVTADQSLRSFVLLDNGQTWASTDGGMDLDSDELVTIKHAALGSFMLVSTVSKHSYHVHRVR